MHRYELCVVAPNVASHLQASWLRLRLRGAAPTKLEGRPQADFLGFAAQSGSDTEAGTWR
jgi:hypothetical protein